MTNKQSVIKAIKEMNIDKLDFLLDNNCSYMDVSKHLFLTKLKHQFDSVKKQNINSFEKIVHGICDSCNIGCKGYSFITEDKQALDLFIEDDNDVVTDIYLCKNMLFEDYMELNNQMYFFFYEEEKTTFKPSLEYLYKKQKVEIATNDFLLFSNKTISVNDIVYWANKHKEIIILFELPDVLNKKRYKTFISFKELCKNINSIVELYEKYNIANQAMLEYHNITCEKELVYWLFTYEKNNLSDLYILRENNWQKSKLITLHKYPKIMIDFSEYEESFQFSYLYNKMYNELMDKYNPTSEQIRDNGGSVSMSLVGYLKINNMYLDILPES